jgi:signal transduction histidine kinase
MRNAAALLLARTDPGEVARTVTAFAGELFEGQEATLWWWSDTSLVPGAQWRGASTTSVTEASSAKPAAALSDIDTHSVARNGTLVIPLRIDDDRVGTLIVERPSGRAFELSDTARADILADIAAPVLRTARRLRDAEELVAHLRDVDHVKTEFLALASHELRTPITVLSGYLSLLEDGAFGVLPDASREIMPAINARLAEMESLINGMLETARVDDGRLRLEIDAWDLRELVDEAVRRCEVFLHASQRIGLRCPDAPVPVLADRERILTVVTNLVHNAIKYSPEHTDVHCSVSAHRDTATVSVSDRGLGVAAEDLATLFTRFGRIRRDPAAREIAGTGLGLYLSRELARAHGGDILVETSPGEGSTFTLVLPVTN